MSSKTSKSKAAGSAVLLSRRTVTVWVCLIGSMTLVSGLFLWLEPGHPDATSSLSLQAVSTVDAEMQQAMRRHVSVEHGRWDAIVIHHAGMPVADAAEIHHLHRRLGYGGLGYHFVIGNGSKTAEGAIENSYRWRRQLDGVYVPKAISICLTGDGNKEPFGEKQIEKLVKLVRNLQLEFGLPDEAVLVHRQLAAQTNSPGQHFPYRSFFDQISND